MSEQFPFWKKQAILHFVKIIAFQVVVLLKGRRQQRNLLYLKNHKKKNKVRLYKIALSNCTKYILQLVP